MSQYPDQPKSSLSEIPSGLKPVRTSLLRFWRLSIAGTVAGMLINFCALLNPVIAGNPITLGIVRSQDNIQQWPNIVSRLQAIGVNYQTIDLNQINQVNDLNGINVLFLPNIETLTPEQVKVLQDWSRQGGRLIASGPVGRNSIGSVRQNLRSILGAYWAFPLSQPSAIQPIQRCVNPQACSTTWVPPNLVNQSVDGGVIIPSGLNSQMIANWESSAASPAAIATGQAIYLGWYWGSNSSAELDNAWLQSILNRYALLPQVAMTVESNPPNPVAIPIESNPPNPVSIPIESNTNPNFNRPPIDRTQRSFPIVNNSLPTTNSPINIPVPISTGRKKSPEIVISPQPQTNARNLLQENPSPFGNTAGDLQIRPAPLNNTTAYNQPINRNNSLLQEAFTDPSEQTAPAGLEVTQGNEPISNMDAFLMRQELTNLLGRFESSLIAVRAANTNINLQSSRETLVAARNPGSANMADRSFAQGNTAKAISLARATLANFDNLINQRNYSEARQQWLEARQNLWQNYPTDGQRKGAEIRAVWLDRGTIVNMRSPERLAQVFDRLAAAGVNTVFFETVNAGYTIYPSNVAPEQNPLTLGWDPLAAAVTLAHERGMELHAWLWTFATGNQRHNTIINQPPDYPGPVLSAHPDWANLDNKGQRMHKNDKKFYFDPANREVRSYLLRLIGEITSRYKVDGIQLDYIRYPFQDANVGFTFGYGKAAREQFKQLTGFDPAAISPGSGEIWRQWTEFRTEQISSFVSEVSQFLRRNSPNSILSVAVFPHPEHQRVYKIQQDWEVWARRGDVDLIVPMTYAMDTNRLQLIVEPLTDEKTIGSALIVPSVKVLNLSEIVAIDQIQALRDMSTGGYSIFAFESISNAMQNFLTRTQGCGQNNCQNSQADNQIPYRKPFGAAASRYLALKREWSYLLANQHLTIGQAELDSLRSDAQDLGEVLNDLAGNPNSQQVTKARNLLANFQLKLKNSLRQHALEESYQVQAWLKRLESLDMLLRYGERKLLSQN